MSSAQLYDTIGATYKVTRRPKPRIAAQVWAALGDARTVLNVGAGTGSYEPPTVTLPRSSRRRSSEFATLSTGSDTAGGCRPRGA
jgi:hypothetical protein